jgi:subtilisin family serine protease
MALFRFLTTDVHGINAITGSGDPMDDHRHGTLCAGTLGAKGNNTIGVVGVAPEVSIMACKFLSDTGSGFTSDALVCLDYAVGMGVPISSK